MNKNFLFLISALSILLSSCVSSKKYKASQAEIEDLKAGLQKCKEAVADCQASKDEVILEYKTKINDMTSTTREKENKIRTLEEQVEYLKKNNDNLLLRLSDMSVVSKAGAESIRKSLEAMNEKDKYIKDLTSSVAKKDSINLALVMNLKRSLDDVTSDDVNIEVKKGVVYISLSDKMLFKSGSAVINDKATSVLEKIAKIVNDHKDLDILVEGHTDDVPMNTDCIADNWDLSTKRATSVVRLLQKKFNIDPARMTAGGRAEYSPKTSNSSADGKKINRRTEIIILPKLDQFFKLSEQMK
ncbi:MAG: OmpA family protein [Saprospiraceae bacterium]|nr:OmpA family protein [Saprospiraceae bacterium]